MPSRRSRREKNRAKKIAKLNDDCCVGESQDIEERDSFQEAHEKKKTCDRKRYKADPESKKDSMKAQYWFDRRRALRPNTGLIRKERRIA